MRSWRTLVLVSCVLLLLLSIGVVRATEEEDEEELREIERMLNEMHQQEETEETTETETAAPPPIPSPTPEPTAHPTRPPGFEKMELIAFRLEYADEDKMDALMEWTYGWIVRDRGYKDELLRAKDLPDFLHRVLNPAEENIHDKERELLHEAAKSMRDEQGLFDDDKILYIGFLTRGRPVEYVRDLARTMHTHRRRLQEEEESAALDRDL